MMPAIAGIRDWSHLQQERCGKMAHPMGQTVRFVGGEIGQETIRPPNRLISNGKYFGVFFGFPAQELLV